MARSRRKAREAALQTLYEIEVGKSQAPNALSNTLEAAGLSQDLADYAQRLMEGVKKYQHDLDRRIAMLVEGYDYKRLAAVDRNVMRMAAYELFHEPAIPPAVTINEAVDIAKKYSTAESGRFVNGVLGKLLQTSPKANWDPATAPVEEEPEEIVREVPEEPVVETLEADSDEAKRLAKVGGWKLKSE